MGLLTRPSTREGAECLAHNPASPLTLRHLGCFFLIRSPHVLSKGNLKKLLGGMSLSRERRAGQVKDKAGLWGEGAASLGRAHEAEYIN